jgi:XTP/dITP diphosphohydrolase
MIGYTDGDQIVFFEGEIKGKIVSPRGTGGFGWDQIFQPEGYDKTFGEMSLEEKNKISMRKQALTKLKAYLKETKK